MTTIAWIIFAVCIAAASAQNCWHIINALTGQYLQPGQDDQRHAWLSHNRTDSSYWNLIPQQHGNFFIVNRESGLYLGVPPNEEFAVLQPIGFRSKPGRTLSTRNLQFRLHDKRGEIVSAGTEVSLYAASCGGGTDGKVKATARCGLPQCQWRFEGYTCD